MDPINILAEIVFASANDVLAGLQTWEEHEAYLRQTFEEYASKGIRLPYDDTKEPDYEEDYRHTLSSARQADRQIEQKTKSLSGICPGVLPGID